jgi:hypothetical protein
MNLYEEHAEGAQPEEAAMTVEQYQEYKASCEQLLNLSKQAMTLAEDENFKTIVMEAYFTEEPKRLAGLMASGRLNEKQFDECARELASIGSLRTFLTSFIQKGQIAQSELENLEAAWNEAVAAGEVE